jgi:serine/threonine protein kinase
MTNSFVGTLIYSCPEIVSNKAYSEKADILSFGCVVYELMKLKQPFFGINPLMLAKHIVDTDYEEISQGSYSESLRQVVQMAL